MCSEDATVACSKMVHKSHDSIHQKSQIRGAKQTPIPRSAIASQERKLINFDNVNPLPKSNVGRGRMSNFVFWSAESVLFFREWVAMAWSKVLFRAS